jgi:hypothetical protein
MHILGEPSCRTRPRLLLRDLRSVEMCFIAFQSGRRSQLRVENRYCCLQEAIRVSIVETQPSNSRLAPEEAKLKIQHVAINDSNTLAFQCLRSSMYYQNISRPTAVDLASSTCYSNSSLLFTVTKISLLRDRSKPYPKTPPCLSGRASVPGEKLHGTMAA